LRSSEHGVIAECPYLEVEYTLPPLSKAYYIKDHLGSTRAVVDENGAVTESYDYYPFGLKMPGRIFVQGSAVTKNLFIGKELDDETGWYHFDRRPYLAALGRFFNVDPLTDLAPGKTPYHYASNNPINRLDPTGLQDEGDDDIPVFDPGIVLEEVVVVAERDGNNSSSSTATTLILVGTAGLSSNEAAPLDQIIGGTLIFVGTGIKIYEMLSEDNEEERDNPTEDVEVKNKKRLKKKLQEEGYEGVEEFKQDVLGTKSGTSKWQVWQNKGTKELILRPRVNPRGGIRIPTGIKIQL